MTMAVHRSEILLRVAENREYVQEQLHVHKILRRAVED